MLVLFRIQKSTQSPPEESTLRISHSRKMACELFLIRLGRGTFGQVRRIHSTPANSVQAEQRLKKFAIYRWNPDKSEEKPQMQEYSVDLNAFRLDDVSDYLISWNGHMITDMDCVNANRISRGPGPRSTDYKPMDTEFVSGP
ncbi:unnamed protein product [Timema podura]|uniref:Protein kinase domain-containing protein n=1 Tax=Timema podura TaxID=61482 RepID=A0ABN7PBI0_TIMPD|nr:unnamed protein product [Timema podura]